LAWLLDMTRAEKEEFVIRLYKEGKSIREIAKLMHMSFRDIGTIINKVKAEIERESGQLEEKVDSDIKSKSKTTQAIKLFSEGKNLVDVLIALDLPPEDVQIMYREFLGLKNMDKLVEVYDEMENYLPSLLELFRLIESRGINKNDIIDVLKLINTGQLPYLQKKVANLTYGLNWLENEIKKKRYNLSILDNRTRELTYIKEGAYPISIEDKSIAQVPSNMGLTRRNNFNKNNASHNFSDDSYIEVFYASGDWQNVIR
jgi:hypothetical protein